jgi:monolysocardiolipin acyltransferase
MPQPTLADPRVRAALARFRPDPSWKRHVATPFVVLACRILVQGLNRLEMSGRERFEHALALDRPLLTFSNHTSLFDDPWLVATFSSWRWSRARWCATDALNFFDDPLTARFFSFGKGVPIVRGAGLDQPGMHFLVDRLRRGDWVHIFPEGGRSRTPGELALPLKSGLAHLVRDTRPVLLPFHHRGMADILPIGSHIPRVGKRVELVFGEALDTAEGLADEPPDTITAWATRQLVALQAEGR